MTDKVASIQDELVKALTQLRGLFSGDPNGDYVICRRDRGGLNLGEQMTIGLIMEDVDAALAKAKGE
jgi:hypothetical protein